MVPASLLLPLLPLDSPVLVEDSPLDPLVSTLVDVEDVAVLVVGVTSGPVLVVTVAVLLPSATTPSGSVHASNIDVTHVDGTSIAPARVIVVNGRAPVGKPNPTPG
jgi:hypothetical protein